MTCPRRDAPPAGAGSVRAAPRRRVAFSVAVWAWMIGLVVVHALAGLVLLPWTLLADRDRRTAAGLGAWLVRRSMAVAACGRGLVRGMEAVDLSRPAVVVLCHRSVIDTAVVVGLPGAPRLWGKPWVGRVPPVRLAMWIAGHFVFDPSDLGDVRDMLDRAEGLLRRGVSVAFYPEGTRHTGPGLGEFSGGAFECAVRSGADVLPVLVIGTGELLPPGSLVLRDAAPVVVPLARIPAGTDRRGLLRRVRAAMLSELEAQQDGAAA